MDRYNHTFEPAPVITKRRLLAAAVAAGTLVLGMIKLGDALPLTRPEQQVEFTDLTGAELGNMVNHFYSGTSNDVFRSIGARELTDAEASVG